MSVHLYLHLTPDSRGAISKIRLKSCPSDPGAWCLDVVDPAGNDLSIFIDRQVAAELFHAVAPLVKVAGLKAAIEKESEYHYHCLKCNARLPGSWAQVWTTDPKDPGARVASCDYCVTRNP